MDFVDLWMCGRIRCLHLIRIASCKTYSLQWFRVLGASFSRFWGLRFRDRVLRFRDLGASFSSFGCFVLRSSFSSASFSQLPSIALQFLYTLYKPQTKRLRARKIGFGLRAVHQRGYGLRLLIYNNKVDLGQIRSKEIVYSRFIKVPLG